MKSERPERVIIPLVIVVGTSALLIATGLVSFSTVVLVCSLLASVGFCFLWCSAKKRTDRNTHRADPFEKAFKDHRRRENQAHHAPSPSFQADPILRKEIPHTHLGAETMAYTTTKSAADRTHMLNPKSLLLRNSRS